MKQQTSANEDGKLQTQLQSASVVANEYELPPGINYQDEIKSNALKIINGECLIIDLQEKFYQEYLGNEDKYAYLLDDYTKVNTQSSVTYTQNNYSYETNNWEGMSVTDFFNLYNPDKILKSMNDYYVGVKVMIGLITATTVIAWATATFYWCAWWMFGGNIPFAIAASLQATTLTILTVDSWNEFNSVSSDIDMFNEIKSCLDESSKMKLGLLINAYSDSLDLKLAITQQFADVIWLKQLKRKISDKLSKWALNGIEMAAEMITNRSQIFISRTLTSKAIILSTSWASVVSAVLNIIANVVDVYSFSLTIWKLSIF